MFLLYCNLSGFSLLFSLLSNLCYILNFSHTLSVLFQGELVLLICIFRTWHVLIVFLLTFGTVRSSALKAVEHLFPDFVVAFSSVFRWESIFIQWSKRHIPVILRNLECWVPVEHLRFNNILLHELWILRADLLRHNIAKSQLKLLIDEKVRLSFLNFPSAAIFGTLDRINCHANTWSNILFHTINA